MPKDTPTHWLLIDGKPPAAPGSWLGPSEMRHLAGLRVERRRRDWLLGRWTAKQALLSLPDLALGPIDPVNLEILSKESGAPLAVRDGQPLPISLSLSHRGGAALCALGLNGAVGCDLELVEPRSEAFQAIFMTPREQQQVRSGALPVDLLVNAIWSAKESLLKLWGLGLAGGPRSLEVAIQGTATTSRAWQPLTVRRLDEGEAYPGWWFVDGQRVVTLVAAPPPRRPQALRPPGSPPR